MTKFDTLITQLLSESEINNELLFSDRELRIQETFDDIVRVVYDSCRAKYKIGVVERVDTYIAVNGLFPRDIPELLDLFLHSKDLDLFKIDPYYREQITTHLKKLAAPYLKIRHIKGGADILDI